MWENGRGKYGLTDVLRLGLGLAQAGRDCRARLVDRQRAVWALALLHPVLCLVLVPPDHKVQEVRQHVLGDALLRVVHYPVLRVVHGSS